MTMMVISERNSSKVVRMRCSLRTSKRAGRFIEDQDVGLLDECSRDAEPLLFSSGPIKLAGDTVSEALTAKAGEIRFVTVTELTAARTSVIRRRWHTHEPLAAMVE